MDKIQKAIEMAKDCVKDLESVLESDEAGNDEIRDAALSAQDTLNSITLLLAKRERKVQQSFRAGRA